MDSGVRIHQGVWGTGSQLGGPPGGAREKGAPLGFSTRARLSGETPLGVKACPELSFPNLHGLALNIFPLLRSETNCKVTVKKQWSFELGLNESEKPQF